MGFFAVFAIEGKSKPLEADGIASAKGWAAWQEWASSLGEDYPTVVRLGEDAELWPASALAALEKELRELARERPEDPSADVMHVGEQLRAVLRERPEKAGWMGITDGEPGGGEE